MTKSLSFESIPKDEQRNIIVVEAHEFGVDEKDGAPYVARVRSLTVSEWEILVKGSVDIQATREQRASLGEAGELVLRDDFDDACLVTAWCTIDDDDRLVFGRSKREAERRVRALPSRYYPAILRIYRAALRASNLSSDSDEQAELIDPETSAEKN